MSKQYYPNLTDCQAPAVYFEQRINPECPLQPVNYVFPERNGRHLNPRMKYSKAFEPNCNIVQPLDHCNYDGVLHNNMHSNVLHEQMVRYSMVIDSADRDPIKYPNPFDFKVVFKPLNFVSGPNIPLELKNVHSVNLDVSTLPRCYVETLEGITHPPVKYTDDHKCTHVLDDDRFTMLDILELRDPLIYSTNNPTQKSFSLLYDTLIYKPNAWFYIATGVTNPRIYKEPIQKISMLTIKFLDSYGKQLELPYIDTHVPTPGYCICHELKYTPEQKTKCVCKYPQHPLNPLLQTHLVFTVEMLEDTLHMKTPVNQFNERPLLLSK